MSEQEYDNFARKFSGLFHEKPSEHKKSPIYSELTDVEKRYTSAVSIAQGGMKNIKKVFDQSTARSIALAEPLPEIDESYYEIFLKEARLTALLDHPNIISIHDIGLNEQGTPYFTMDLKSGDTLEDIFRQLSSANEKYLQFYRLEELLLIFVKVCDAVAYAHSRNIIHLDLKPSNIQVGDYGEVLVCDWGLGKIQTQQQTDSIEELLLDADLLNHVVSKNKVVGTPGYMAPEQISPDMSQDETTDIYALGGILYSIVTHKRPLSGEVDDIFKATLAGDIPTADKVTSMPVPESLLAVINSAMSVNKDERYATVSQLKHDVQKYLSGYSTTAENAGLIKEFSLFVKRNKSSAAVSFAALAILIVVTSFFIDSLKLKISETEHQRQKAEILAEKFKIEKNKAQLHAEQFANERDKSQELLKKTDLLVNQLIDNYLSDTGLMAQTTYLYPQESLERTVHYCTEVLKLSPDKQYAKIKLLQSLFIMQRFKDVHLAELENNKQYKELYQISNKYKSKLNKRSQLLSISDLADLIKGFRGVRRFPTAEKMICYDKVVRPGKNDYSPIIKAILTLRNSDWDEQGFDYHPETRTLSLSSPDLKELSSKPAAGSRLCMLRFLEIDTLTLSHCGVVNIIPLAGLKIHTLDLRHSSISSLRYINKLKLLRQLIVAKGQYPQSQLNSLPAYIEVKVL